MKPLQPGWPSEALLTIAKAEVSFEQVDGALSDRIDEGYQANYPTSPYLEPMIGARGRSATVRIIPRG
jgi:hypothetical protein